MYHLFNHKPFYLITHVSSQIFNTHILNLTNYSIIIYTDFVRDNKIPFSKHSTCDRIHR